MAYKTVKDLYSGEEYFITTTTEPFRKRRVIFTHSIYVEGGYALIGIEGEEFSLELGSYNDSLISFGIGTIVNVNEKIKQRPQPVKKKEYVDQIEYDKLHQLQDIVEEEIIPKQELPIDREDVRKIVAIQSHEQIKQVSALKDDLEYKQYRIQKEQELQDEMDYLLSKKK